MTSVVDVAEVGELTEPGDIPAGAGVPEPDGSATSGHDLPSLRVAVAVALPVVAAGLVLGAIFQGAGGPITGAVAGALGVWLATVVTRVRRAGPAYVVAIAGITIIGVVAVLPGGLSGVLNLRAEILQAQTTGDLLRPPVALSAGWRALLGWLAAMLGFTVGWAAVDFRRPTTALVLPLPFIALAAISLPENVQVAYGVAAVVLFAAGLGLLAGTRSGTEGGVDAPLAFELRRLTRSLPVVVLIIALLVLLTRSDLLFPAPYIDPAREPQKPRTVPLSEVEDRVLFEVESTQRGPWRLGGLDVYDGLDWRLAPFAASQIADVPEDGIVDRELEQGVAARFLLRGLGGTVLPTLPNPVGVQAIGPRLAYDPRNGNLRTAQGQLEPDLEYVVVAAALPTIADLRQVTGALPADIVPFTEIGEAPDAIVSLILQAPTTSKWDQFDWLRSWVLDNVVSSGPGIPVSITPERAAEIVAVTREASPFEIVALQSMLARWIDVASRIGYGFDGGEEIGPSRVAVRPRHGAAFPEVYFPGYKWLPVLGVPKNAKPSVGSDDEAQFDPSVVASDEIGVEVFVPVVLDPPSRLLQQIRLVVLIVVPTLLLLAALYIAWPAVRKRRLRARRRRAALRAGPAARVAVAYGEWRDVCTDLGYRHDGDTPLMFLDRFIPDSEHEELAWLVSRGVWGDMSEALDDAHAGTAEELSRALQSRVLTAHPGTLRFVAAVSRLSLRDPYFDGMDVPAPRQLPARRSGRGPGRPEPEQEVSRERITIDA